MTEPSSHEDTRRGSESGFMERMIEKRREHCEYLGHEVVARIVERYCKDVAVGSNPPPTVSSPTEKCLYILKKLLTVAKDKAGVPAAARRKGFDKAKKMLKLIDEAIAKKEGAGRSRSNSAAGSSGSIPDKRDQNQCSSAQDEAADQSVELASSSRGPLHMDSTSTRNDRLNQAEQHTQAAGPVSSAAATRKPSSETTESKSLPPPLEKLYTEAIQTSSTVPGGKKAAPENDLGVRWQPAGNTKAPATQANTTTSRTSSVMSNSSEGVNRTKSTGGPAATKPTSKISRWSAPKLGTPLPERANEGMSSSTTDDSTATAKPASTKPSQCDVSASQRLPTCSTTGAPTQGTQLPGRSSRSVSQENPQDLAENGAALSEKPSQGHSHAKTTSRSVQKTTAPGEAPPYQRRSPFLTSGSSVSASHSSNGAASGGDCNASQRVLGRSAKALLDKSPQQSSSNNSTASQFQGRSAKVVQGKSTERSGSTTTLAQNTQKQLASAGQHRSAGIQAPRSLNAAQHCMAQQGSKILPKVVLKVPADVFRPGTKLLYSFAVNERDHKLQLTYQPSPVMEYTALDIHDRLTKWDPYWKPLAFVALGTTSTVSDCVPQHVAGSTAARIEVNPNTNINLDGKTVTLGSLEGLSWGKGHYSSGKVKTGEIALLLRMLPLSPKAHKRADCHLWPKGTFLQIQNKPYEIFQRKQQTHDLTEWKGTSKHIDLCNYVNSFTKPFTVQMCCHDRELYHFSVSVCEYRSPETLFGMLTGDGPGSLPKLSRESGFEVAIGFAHRETFVIDGDHEEEDVGKFVFSLCCPFSKTLMATPVRSTKCKHWQCFDLKMFLNMNSHVTGSRWRCATCEQFVALDDLQICGLTSSLLDEFKDVATVSRGRVQFCSDRSYTLLAEQRRRYNKRPSEQEIQVYDVSVKRQKTDQDVIDLL